MTTTNTDTNPQVTPSPLSVVSPKAHDFVDLISKKQQKARSFDPPSRRGENCHRHHNITVWYYTKQVLSFLVFSVVWTLFNVATGVGIRIITRLPTKISVSIRVIQVLKYLYYFSVLCIGFIRSGLKSKTNHVQNRYARQVLTFMYP